MRLRLALRAVWFYRARSLLVMASIATALVLPAGLEIVFAMGSSLLLNRAATTPLILVAPGSKVDQVLSALYFEPSTTHTGQAELDRLNEAGLAQVVPVYVRFRARGAPVVGTSLDYFERRALVVADGQMFSILGEAVLGARVAGRLGLRAGEHVLTDSESPFDLTATLPLQLEISGVLAPTGGPDDDAILVDLKTTWVIQGLGHGHEETDPTNPMPRTHRRITQANASSFHFHGDRGAYPVTAALVWPRDEKSRALLHARYDERDPSASHLVDPGEVMGRVSARAFELRRLLRLASGLAGLASLVLLSLVVSLSLSLRRRELETLARLGVPKRAINALLARELLLVVLPAIFAAILGLLALSTIAADLWFAMLRT